MKIPYAPIIESSIPSFPAEQLKVSFRLHPAVSIGEIDKVKVKIFELDTNNTLWCERENDKLYFLNDGRSGYAYFNVAKSDNNGSEIIRNTVYKIQIAFVNDDDVGVYSSIAYGKCIFYPYIQDFSAIAEGDQQAFSCFYACRSLAESIAKYRFVVKKWNTDELLEDSGWLIWDSFNDTEKKLIVQEGGKLVEDSNGDKYRTSNLFIYLNKFYACAKKITLQIQTVGGYEKEKSLTVPFTSSGFESVETNESWSPRVSLGSDFERGGAYFEIKFGKVSQTGSSSTFLEENYEVLLLRADNKDNFLSWTPLISFTPDSSTHQETIRYIDTTVESGVKYKYAFVRGRMEKLGNGIVFVDNRYRPINAYEVYNGWKFYYTGSPIQASLEDTFLSDGEKILPIRFNPKVSGFKTINLEQKVDTIGGQYPFFFRNGTVNYKEIPISGLISHLMDEKETFMTKAELGIADRPQTTDLSNNNISAEKKFKLAVLEWLSNGKPKLFRSPTEGNYLIRLMNISLSPNDTLGRMLHSFQATGYEIGDAQDYIQLRKYDIDEGAIILWTTADFH